ncbi:hypothetical protein ACFL34_04765 [Candidatus Sumerlaeota bacterium]
MGREAVDELVRRLHEAQGEATRLALEQVAFEDLPKRTPDGFSVQDTLRMWVWHFWTHQRELVRARGSLAGENPHFHAPHFVRQANEEFGRFVGEPACLTDEQLELPLPGGDRTACEIVEHVLGCLTGYFPEQLAAAAEPADEEGAADDDE